MPTIFCCALKRLNRAQRSELKKGTLYDYR
ncbi:Uncharacterised protein [Vibrio cholerae]|nr:Uncharacterised protein [Vibrio cholerae]